jgi:hypothetical protein
VVSHTSAVTGEVTTWDVTDFPVPLPVRLHLAQCLAAAAGPRGTHRSTATVKGGYGVLRRFANLLAQAENTPQTPHDLKPAHLAAFRLRYASNQRSVGMLRSLLRRRKDAYSEPFRVALATANVSHAHEGTDLASYSTKELRLLLGHARNDVRAARNRIRKNVAHLERWLGGGIDRESDPQAWHLGSLLEEMARTGDIPRFPRGGPNYKRLTKCGVGVGAGHLLFLKAEEVISLIVLLVALSSHNVEPLSRATVEYHRTDAGDNPRTVIVDLLKPRRGKHRAHMQVPLRAVIPDWLPAPGAGFTLGRKELLSGLGVYLLAVELTEPARRLAGSDQLFCWLAGTGNGIGRGIRTRTPVDAVSRWSDRAGLVGDDGEPLRLDWRRIRLTSVQSRNEPVAHRRQTLNHQYLIKDRGDLARYQRIVAATLEERVAAARETTRLAYLTVEDLAEARRDPEAVAARLSVSVRTLEAVLGGRLDTVLAACKDNENGPYTPGRPCQASFMLCTDCECAVSLPRHLPVQVAAHDALLGRRDETNPLEWAERYGPAWARLDHLLGQHSRDVIGAARSDVSDLDRDLVERLLNRELDT